MKQDGEEEKKNEKMKGKEMLEGALIENRVFCSILFRTEYVAGQSTKGGVYMFKNFRSILQFMEARPESTEQSAIMLMMKWQTMAEPSLWCR